MNELQGATFVIAMVLLFLAGRLENRGMIVLSVLVFFIGLMLFARPGP